MNRTKPNPPVLIDLGARADDVDPWSEFLSESGEDAHAGGDAPAQASPEDAFLTESDAPVPAADQTSLAAHTSLEAPSDPEPFVSSESAAGEVEYGDVPAADTTWSAEPAEPPPDAEDLIEPATPASAMPTRVVRFSPAPAASRDPDAPGWDVYRWQRDHEPAASEGPRPERDRVAQRSVAAAGPRPAAAALASRLDDPATTPVVRDASLSLADVLARRPSVRPAEAVAAIQELCAVLTDPARPAALVPDARDVLISPSGVVSVRPGAKGDRDARSLSRMLHALLASSTPPLPLRLFVTSAITSERYRSLSLFAEALSHYGSQNRGELIRGLYRRTRETTVPADAPEGSRSDVSPRAGRSTSRRSLRRALVALAGAAALMLAAAGVWRWQAVLLPPPADPAADGGGSGTPGQVRRAGLVRDNWQLGPVTVPEEPPPQAAAPPRPAAARTRSSVPLLPLPVAAPAPPAPVPVVPSPADEAAQREPVGPPPLASRSAAAPVNAARTAEVPLDPRIYSREHLDVQPPTLLPSQQLAIAPTLSENVKSSLELLIDERGQVQRARLRNRPQRFSDVSLLSQAKMLKFRPAVRNGTPVKYLLEMDSLGSSD